MAKTKNTKSETKVLSINLETQTAPKVQEIRGRNYIEYGASEGWNNLYPQFLIDLFYNSSTHSAIISSTAEMIAGEEIICEDEHNINLELKAFIEQANSNESLHDIIKKISLDLKLQGGFALNLIWNADRTKIVELFHVPVERLRVGIPNEMGQVDTYHICSDWTDPRQNLPQEVPAFNLNDRTSASQILYTGIYSPNMDIYHVPDYVAGCSWALTDQKVSQFHLSNIENSFSGSYFINFNNGVPSQKERLEIESSIVNKFVGSKAAGKFVLSFSDDKNREPSIVPINPPDLDKQYLALQELLVSNILTSHRVVSPLLFGIRDTTGLGNNANEMSEAFDLYLNSVIKPYQQKILSTLKKILSINNINYPLAFVQNRPLTNKFGTDTLLEVMTQDEIREELGLEPLITKEKNETTDALNTMSPLIANKVLNNLTLDETRDLVGLQSIDESELPQEEVKMCLGDDGESRVIKSNKLDLKNYIEKYGEDIPDDWELIDEESAEGEHPDFDFEAELNDLCKTELSKIELEEEWEKDEEGRVGGRRGFVSGFFRVRYQYTHDSGLYNESGTSRDFCQTMMSANKVYKKSVILDMEGENSEFAQAGHSSYSIWIFKGGSYCEHFFKRLIFRTSIGRGMKREIDDSMIVSTAKARSEGFYPESEDIKVSTAPKRMKDRGSIKNSD